jgi:hypothetical protein
VRANNKSLLGFLKDARRLNVSITRPKHFLFIIGHSQTLVQDEKWKSMVAYYAENGLTKVVDCDRGKYFSLLQEMLLAKAKVTEGSCETPGNDRDITKEIEKITALLPPVDESP